MQIVIDIPKSLYANLQKIQNGSIAAKRILECVRNGKQTDVPDTNVGECDDAISRQAAIDAIWDGTNMDIYTREVKECLEALPPVIPAEKVGRWYKKPHEICYTCDQCRTTNASGVKYNFCPHCGAKMQEVGE